MRNFCAEINQLFFIEKKFDLILQEKNLGSFYEQRREFHFFLFRY
jgi:hypothetical protein